MNKIKVLLLTSLIILLSTSSFAVEMDELYRVRIAVDDQLSTSRKVAALDAFKEVLVRKSGNISILSAYEVQQSFPSAVNYLQRYEYNRNESYLQPNSPTQFNQSDIVAEKKFELVLDFEPRLIDELIQISGMPIWGSNRPLTIMWLAIEKDFERQIIKEEAEVDSFSNQLKTHAVRRGIATILPLMDLEDQLNVSLSDVWGRFNSPIVTASERYAADSIVTGRISQYGDLWQAKVSYITDNSEAQIELTSSTAEALLGSITDSVTDLLCQRYCVVEVAESHQIVMQISNITNFKSFVQVKKYLSGLSAIRKVEVDKISGVNLRLNLSLLGDIQAVKEALSLNNKLVEEPNPDPDLFAEVKAENHIDTSYLLDNLGLTENKDVVAINENSEPALIDPNGTQVNAAEQATTTASKDSDENKQDAILYYRWVE